jgi:hypothetical protein
LNLLIIPLQAAQLYSELLEQANSENRDLEKVKDLALVYDGNVSQVHLYARNGATVFSHHFGPGTPAVIDIETESEEESTLKLLLFITLRFVIYIQNISEMIQNSN